MSTAFDQVLQQLPHLDTAQLRQVQLRVQFLLQGVTTTTPKSETDLDQDWLLGGFLAELRSRGLFTLAPVSKIVDRVPSYPSEAAQVRAYLEDRSGGGLSSARKMALGKAAARALIDYLEFLSIPVGLKMLLNNVAKIPDAVESSFPGYQSAGLLGMLSLEKRAHG